MSSLETATLVPRSKCDEQLENVKVSLLVCGSRRKQKGQGFELPEVSRHAWLFRDVDAPEPPPLVVAIR
jgi:hypothetical protein